MKQYQSTHHCRKCQKFHHTLLHSDQETEIHAPTQGVNLTANASPDTLPGALLMTCCVLSHGPDGSSIHTRALLDSASSVSFVSECLAQALHLKQSHRDTRIHGVAGLSHDFCNQSLANFVISPLQGFTKEINMSVVIVPRVTCEQLTQPIPFRSE